MAKTSSKIRNLTATLWALVFAAGLGLVVAHLVTEVREQTQQEGSLIEATFTQAPERPAGAAAGP